MLRRKKQYTITTVRGASKSSDEFKNGANHLDFKVERIVNQKSSEGWRLQEVVACGSTTVHIVLVK